MTNAKTITDFLKKNDVKYVDLRFTDPLGKMHHITHHAKTITEAVFKSGLAFDGSSVTGWKDIHDSDMILLPDPATAVIDPFYAEPTMLLFCDIYDPATGKPYTRCPRAIARKAEKHLLSSGAADAAYFGPEAAFFVFDEALFGCSPLHAFAKLDPSEKAEQVLYPASGLAHQPARGKDGAFPVNPVDNAQDLRTEILSMLQQIGVGVEKHRHEGASAQHKIGLSYATLVHGADNLQLCKYIVHNIAHAYGKAATFMPKPIGNQNGSGLHTHQSLWKGGKPLFAGKDYAGLSKTALYYIGGILKHARALNALTNPTTNSYKRLVPGYEAPVLLAYGERNRSASCRIPHTNAPQGKRIDVRFPDPSANPYLAYAAMLMAGLDGIKNKIDPGKAMEENLYELQAKDRAKTASVCSSLKEAIEALEKDHAFLLKGDVFTKDMIEAYLDLKRAEWLRYRGTPHPVEFDMYFSG